MFQPIGWSWGGYPEIHIRQHVIMHVIAGSVRRYLFYRKCAQVEYFCINNSYPLNNVACAGNAVKNFEDEKKRQLNHIFL